MSKKRKIILWLSVISALIISGAYFLFANKKPVTEYTTALAEKTSITQTVSTTGELVDNEEITLNFEVGGRVKKIMVKEGDRIAEGETIATIDDAGLSSEANRAKALLDKAISDAKINDDLIRESKVAEDNALAYLKETKDLNDQNISAANQAVNNAEDYYKSAKDLYDDSSTKTNKLTLVSAENSLKTAKEAKKTVEEQGQLSEISAENSLETAKSKTETLESNFAERSRNASVQSAQASYDIAINNLAKASLVSPINGTVTKINNKEGEVLGSGVIKESFTKVISGDFIIESNIPESDIVKVKQSMKALVSFDALSGDEKFQAEVVEVSPAETVVQDVVYYRVKLKLDNVDSRLKPGMTANIDIQTAKKDDVLIVPMRAVKTEADHKYVEILGNNNQTQKIEVTTGIEGDDGMVEIKSGVKEGDKVVTFIKTP